MPNQPPPISARRSLRKDCLSFSEVIAQSISVIAPSTVPAAVLGLIFVSAGNGTWLSFLIGMVGLLFVCYNINQFARRSASPGSLYTYIVKGLGPSVGVLGGWGLLFGYAATGMSTLCGFGIFSGLLLGPLGFHPHILALFAFGVLTAGYIAFKDIRLSARMMLYFEFASLGVILLLGIAIWWQKGFAIDRDQFTLQGVTPGGILVGVVLVAFGFSGFESATSLGAEAKDPLRTIPRSLTQSTLLAGGFFIFMAYVITLGFKDSGMDLGTTEAPLGFLAPRSGFGFLGTFVNIGVLLSFFACTLACINSTARIFFSMARHGLFHDALGDAHETNQTPHIAIFIAGAATLFFPTLAYAVGISPFEAQGYFGTLASFGFLSVYMLVSIAAPVYLHHVGRLRKVDVVLSVLGVAFMILPVIGTIGLAGSTLFPPPEFPGNIFIWVFAAYMLAGLGWLFVQRARSPRMIHGLKTSVDEIHRSFGDVKEGVLVPVPASATEDEQPRY